MNKLLTLTGAGLIALSSCSTSDEKPVKDSIKLKTFDGITRVLDIKPGHQLKEGDTLEIGNWHRFVDRNINNTIDKKESVFHHNELNLEGDKVGDINTVKGEIKDKLESMERAVVVEIRFN